MLSNKDKESNDNNINSFFEIYEVKVSIDFCYGHRLCNHEDKCKNLHGHNAKAVIYIDSLELDKVGRVVDFSVVKASIKKWIDENWDHSLIYYENDRLIVSILEFLENSEEKLKTYKLPYNPTVENLAKHLYEVVKKMLPRNLFLRKVEIYESDSSSASFGKYI